VGIGGAVSRHRSAPEDGEASYSSKMDEVHRAEANAAAANAAVEQQNAATLGQSRGSKSKRTSSYNTVSSAARQVNAAKESSNAAAADAAEHRDSAGGTGCPAPRRGRSHPQDDPPADLAHEI
jgi:hypothetical protein